MKPPHALKFGKKEPPKPPSTLGPSGKKLWRSIEAEYCFDDAGGLAHLLSACRCEDAIARLSAKVAEEGDLLPDAKGIRRISNPLLSKICAFEDRRRAAIKALNLDAGDAAPKKVGRPVGRGNSYE